MKYFQFSFLCVFTLILAGCLPDSQEKAADSSSTVSAQSSKVAGPDLNSNGVRDDIDALIVKMNTPHTGKKDELFIKAYTQDAQTLQKIVVNTDSAIALQLEEEELRNLYCMAEVEKHYSTIDPTFQMPGAYLDLQVLSEETFNTGPRLMAKQRYDKAIQNKKLSYDVNTDTSKSCDFKIK